MALHARGFAFVGPSPGKFKLLRKRHFATTILFKKCPFRLDSPSADFEPLISPEGSDFGPWVPEGSHFCVMGARFI